MSRANWTVACSIFVFASLAASWVSTAAAEQGPLPKHRGYAEYQQYCASCHGVRADGTGPMAPVLNVPPANLRLLSVKYGSPLPRPKLIAFIDGQTKVRGHGSREMPVWGKQLYQSNRNDQARASHVRGAILVILDYLEALQVDPDAASDKG